MAVVLRLKRIGTTRRPVFRIVATDSRNPKDGRFIEEIGLYDPRRSPAVVKVNKELAEYWISVGAKPSPTVSKLLKK